MQNALDSIAMTCNFLFMKEQPLTKEPLPRGAGSIQFGKETGERLKKLSVLLRSPSQKYLATVALDWALAKIEKGECAIVNGQLVATKQKHPQAA